MAPRFAPVQIKQYVLKSWQIDEYIDANALDKAI